LAITAGALLVAGLAWTARPPEAGAVWRVAFVTLHVAGCAGLWALVRRTGPTVGQLVVGAVVFRLIALPMLPSLSDDGYRYLWDGVVRVEGGVSPYAFRPSDPRLAALDDGVLLERMNSPGYYSVYPPASQAVFAAAAPAHGAQGWRMSWWFLKLLLQIAEGIGIACLLRRLGPRATALYAWSPLAVIEIAGQGHTEALVVAGLGLVLVGGRLPLASLGATVAGLAKLYPFALLPFAWRRDGAAGVAVSAALIAGLTALFWTPGAIAHAGESLALFFGTLDEYAAPYRLLKAALYPLLAESAGRAASVALSLGFAAVLAGVWLGDDGTRRTLTGAVLAVVLGVALTSTTLHPWYWLPVLFILPLLESKTWIYWLGCASSTAYLGYVLPEAALAATAVGWGGGLLLFVRERPWRHGFEHRVDRRRAGIEADGG